VADLSREELQSVFDFLELKRGEKLGCWICGRNDWSARKVRRAETGDPATAEVWTLHVELICKNCKMVTDFTDRVLQGP